MSLARHLDRVLRRNLGMHVAWVPIATRYSLGDYGLRRGGVFEPIGNISEYGVESETATGREVALDFVSSDATSVRVMGEADVVSLASLPPGIRERWVTPDGRWRVQARPAEDLSSNSALERFVAEPRRGRCS